MASRNPLTESKQKLAGKGSMGKEAEAKAGISGSKKLHVPDSKKIDVVHAHRLFYAKGPGRLMTSPNVVRLNLFGNPSGPTCTAFKTTVPPGLKPIYVNGMDEDQEWVYVKRILRLTLIEDPMFGFSATNVAGQDAKGKVIRVSIYDTPQNEQFAKLLAFGTQLGIINPYHRIAVDGKNGIRVEDPNREIVHLGRKENMCRYCGDENAERKCSKCKVTYCSRDCQVADWKVLNHKMICNK